MVRIKSTDTLHEELLQLIREHRRMLEEVTNGLATGDSRALATIALEGGEYAAKLAYLLSDVIHTVGGLAVALGREDFAAGPGVAFPDGSDDALSGP